MRWLLLGLHPHAPIKLGELAPPVGGALFQDRLGGRLVHGPEFRLVGGNDIVAPVGLAGTARHAEVPAGLFPDFLDGALQDVAERHHREITGAEVALET